MLSQYHEQQHERTCTDCMNIMQHIDRLKYIWPGFSTDYHYFRIFSLDTNKVKIASYSMYSGIMQRGLHLTTSHLYNT